MRRYVSNLNPTVKEQYDELSILRRLQVPDRPVDAVLDTDTYNEIDDQFALAYMIRSEDGMRIKGIHAAPFSFKPGRATDPKEGMEKSYQEIRKLLGLLGREDLAGLARKGSGQYLPDENTPIRSEAADHLAELAKLYSSDNPLYIVSIGAITNVASFLLLYPELKDNVVVIWLGGNSLEWPDIYEYNMKQDVAAARVVFGSGVPLVLLPCRGVVSGFSISKPEAEYWLRGKNALCDYLAESLIAYAESKSDLPTWTKPIWDVAAVAWLLGGFMLDRLEISPIPEYDFQWGRDRTRHLIRYVYYVERDLLMNDLIKKLTGRKE